MKKINRFKIYYLSLIGIAISLPFSSFLMSISQIILFLNWVFDKKIKEKLIILKKNKTIKIASIFIIVHILGLIYTQDFEFAIKDIKIKIIFIFFLFIISSYKKLNIFELKKLLFFFSIAVTISTFISTAFFFDFIKNEFTDIRKISTFISHIRFSLLINISIFSCAYFILFFKKKMKFLEKFFYSTNIIWNIIFLIILQSLTGIFIFLMTSFLIILYKIYNSKSLNLKLIFLISISFFFILTFFFIKNSVEKFYKIEKIDIGNLEKKTEYSNFYKHYKCKKDFENGNYIWLYFCEKELKNTWNKKSNFIYDALDKKGQKIKHTLIRYLTSLGLRKDKNGVDALTKKDISNIENGISNYIYADKFSLYAKVHKIIWQIDNYKNDKNPSGHSITQRIEFLKNSLKIIKKNFFIGVGTGDLKIAFEKEYEISNTKLFKKFRLRAHNQFVSFFMAFGILGFLIILFSLIYPIFLQKKEKNFFIIIFLIISFLSFLNEDTLETRAGATFFAYFYALFLFQKRPKF